MAVGCEPLGNCRRLDGVLTAGDRQRHDLALDPAGRIGGVPCFARDPADVGCEALRRCEMTPESLGERADPEAEDVAAAVVACQQACAGQRVDQVIRRLAIDLDPIADLSRREARLALADGDEDRCSPCDRLHARLCHRPCSRRRPSSGAGVPADADRGLVTICTRYRFVVQMAIASDWTSSAEPVITSPMVGNCSDNWTGSVRRSTPATPGRDG